MKLLYISNSRIPTEKAHGRQIMKMCECFAELGIGVELVIPTRKNILREQNTFNYYGNKNNFSIKKLKTVDPTFLFAAPRGWFIKFQSVCFGLRLFGHLIFKKNLQDHIFYTRDEYLLPLLLMFSKIVVWESHALPVHIGRYKKYLKRCAQIIVLTNPIKKDLISLGINGDKILISPDAVDLQVFDIDMDISQARERVKLPLNKKIICYTGSFNTKGMDKGIADILDALKILNNENILFVAVGGSAVDIEFYSKLAQENNVDQNVIFLGPVDQGTLAIYQKAADVLLMPFPYNKHYAFYMSPLKMFEYMASGRPIIASDLPSVRDVLNSENCIFCQPDDAKDLADKIILALHDEHLVDRITQRASQDIKNYTWDKRAQDIIKFINK